MSLNKVLTDTTATVSEEFAIQFQASVTLDGTINSDWKVERAAGSLDDGETRVWNDHDLFEQDENGGIVDGTPGYVYRVNLGTAGPTVNVVESIRGVYWK